MAKTSIFQIRDAGLTPDDEDFIIEAFDSTLPFLASVGSGAQWGSTPFSEISGFRDQIKGQLEKSEKHRKAGEGEHVRVFIAEVEQDVSSALSPDQAEGGDTLRYRTDADGKRFLSVGAAVMQDHFVTYITQHELLAPLVADAISNADFLYLKIMVTDHRAGGARKGAGSAIIDKMKDYTAQSGKKTLFVDGWRGNDGRLIK
jgi:hypothetical protein